MRLPADTHVHSEFSWDVGGPDSPARGTMAASSARAARIGLPAIVFTDHLDLDPYLADVETVTPAHASQWRDGVLHPLTFDAERYLEGIDRARAANPGIRILTGVEWGQPHLDGGRVDAVVDLAALDRINGSLHTLPFEGGRAEPITMYRHLPAAEVMESYLAEIPVMVAGADRVDTVTHLDYAVRHWPSEVEGPFDARRFEEGFRAAMGAIAASGRALELNARQPRWWIPAWFAEEGGREVTFGSDGHVPDAVGENLPELMLMAEAAGFRPRADPVAPWGR